MVTIIWDQLETVKYHFPLLSWVRMLNLYCTFSVTITNNPCKWAKMIIWEHNEVKPQPHLNCHIWTDSADSGQNGFLYLECDISPGHHQHITDMTIITIIIMTSTTTVITNTTIIITTTISSLPTFWKRDPTLSAGETGGVVIAFSHSQHLLIEDLEFCFFSIRCF